MRDPRNALRPFVLKETDDARERLAAAHFALETVREQITAAASRGEGSVRLPLGPITAELRGTEASHRLAEWCKQQGIGLEWVEKIAERSNGIRLRTAEPILSWHDETIAT